jgi:hypothetical protein
MDWEYIAMVSLPGIRDDGTGVDARFVAWSPNQAGIRAPQRWTRSPG